MFERNFDTLSINKLNENPLWNGHLKDDCKNQKVFCAIRKNSLDCYHKGGRLFHFKWTTGFETHFKYASVIANNKNDAYYLKESELATKKLISNFRSNYNSIKENCALYTSIEAQGISEIYHKHSYLSNDNIVVLDIEVSFGGTQDRIDILLFDKSTKTLKFVEAKPFSNNEIWSKTTPKVISQLDRYQKQITENETEIISAYKNYVNELNLIFDKELPEPDKIEHNVTLLIFGFDRDQSEGRLKKLILNNQEYKGRYVYKIGDIKEIDLIKLWNCGQLSK
jgi:hypothetical protein